MPFEMRIAVRRRPGFCAEQFGVLRLEHGLDGRARMLRAAFEARHAVDAAMQFDHALASRTLMQAVHVLRHETLEPPARAKPGERDVRTVRTRMPHDRPADHAARPVAPPRRIGTEELVQLNRR